MKKFYLLFFSTLLLCTVDAQNAIIADNTNVKRCATVEVLAEARRNHPGAETDVQFESWINGKIQERRTLSGNPNARLNANPYNLPVVFHIISNGEAVGTTYNVAAASITQQMLQINKDYANLSNSPYAVSSTTGLSFFLCQRDVSGNTMAEPGIDRINRNISGWTDPTAGWSTTYITNTVKPQSIWDPSRYLNIWIVPYMPGTVANTEILGYATFPSSSTLSGLNEAETNSTAGVVIKYTTVGSIFQPASCTVSYGKGKTLSHELGHFFGLRHIWGDATCATDYVNDTPVHQDANNGVPTHPKPNTCGTADEMFENYMDYSDDIVLNTFTANQVDRMQTVMTNSPRRNTLPTSTVGFTPVTATNRISFNDCSGAMTVSEAGTLGTYPRYKDINLYLNVEDKATGNATVSLTTSGTAILNRDYIITTPTSISFVTGDNYKPVTIRLLDDAAVDGDKTLIVGYTISGTGVTAGTTYQTETITITDDDNYVTTQNQITLLNENFEGTVPGWSTVSFSSATPPNFFTVSTNGNAGGSGACAHVTNDNTLRPNTYTKTAAATVGLRTPLLNINGLQNVTVSFNYRVWGEVSGTTAVDYGRMYSSINAMNYSSIAVSGTGPYAGITDSVSAIASFTLPTSFGNAPFYLAMLWFNNASGGNNPPINIDNFVVRGDGVPVETTVSSSYGYDVPLATINNFRSANNRAILALSGAAANLTNATAAVTEAGTDRPTFAANGTTYLRSRKAITLMATPTATGLYTVKLYYTTAELAAWGTAVSNLKIMKVNNGTLLSAPLNNSNAIILTPTQFEDSTTSRGYYAFTAIVSSGAGQFVLVQNNAALPVKLLSFTGILEKNQTHLNWITTAEVNNQGFAVERSIDATTFKEIGWVNASATNTYELYDATIAKGNKYYYRLKQVDRDGNFTYSAIVTITYTGDNGVTVFPNPVKNNLVIQQTGSSRTSVIITDLTGKTVYSNTFMAGTLQINAQAWSSGIYMVRVIKNNEESSYKVIKD